MTFYFLFKLNCINIVYIPDYLQPNTFTVFEPICLDGCGMFALLTQQEWTSLQLLPFSSAQMLLQSDNIFILAFDF